MLANGAGVNWQQVLANAAIIIGALMAAGRLVLRSVDTRLDGRIHPHIEKVSTSVDALRVELSMHMEEEATNLSDVGKVLKKTDRARKKSDRKVADVLALSDRAFTESVQHVADNVATVQGMLTERTMLFDQLEATMEQTQEVLKTHIDGDEQQFKLSSQALTEGQQALLGTLGEMSTRLGAIEEHQTKLARKVEKIRGAD